LLELGELRWILLGIGIVAIAAIWWWTARRSRQAPGNAELREPTVMPSSPAPSIGEAAHPPERRGGEARGGEGRLEARATMPVIPLEPRAAAQGEAAGEPREAPVTAAETRAADDSRAAGDGAAPRERSVAPLEPLSIRAGDFGDVPELDQPMLIHADPIDFSLDSSRATGGPRFPSVPRFRAAPRDAAPVHMPAEPGVDDDADADATTVRTAGVQLPLVQEPPMPPPAAAREPLMPPSAAPEPLVPPPAPSAPGPAPTGWRPASENSDRYSSTAPQTPNTSEKQKIVALRVCAVGDARWPGTSLINVLEMHGLAYGRFQVFHRKHSDGRSIFCVASLVEPGTFDLSSMPNELYRGVSLFAVLPGPVDPVQTVEAMLDTARDLARELSGTMQDAKGVPFSPQRAEALLKDVSRFQALLA
jgi:cell division protein ZipA